MNDFSSIYIFKMSEIKKPNKSRHIYPVTDIPTLCHLGSLIKIFFGLHSCCLHGSIPLLLFDGHSQNGKPDSLISKRLPGGVFLNGKNGVSVTTIPV